MPILVVFYIKISIHLVYIGIVILRTTVLTSWNELLINFRFVHFEANEGHWSYFKALNTLPGNIHCICRLLYFESNRTIEIIYNRVYKSFILWFYGLSLNVLSFSRWIPVMNSLITIYLVWPYRIWLMKIIEKASEILLETLIQYLRLILLRKFIHKKRW